MSAVCNWTNRCFSSCSAKLWPPARSNQSPAGSVRQGRQRRSCGSIPHRRAIVTRGMLVSSGKAANRANSSLALVGEAVPSRADGVVDASVLGLNELVKLSPQVAQHLLGGGPVAEVAPINASATALRSVRPIRRPALSGGGSPAAFVRKSMASCDGKEPRWIVKPLPLAIRAGGW